MNLRLLYYSDGNVTTDVTVAREGKFRFEGSAPEDALIEIYDNEYRLMGRLVAHNGQVLKVNIDPADASAFTASGNETAERLSAFMRETAGAENADERNAAVERYVCAHTDDPVSALLLMCEFDATGSHAVKADSLMSLIAPEARANGLTDGFRALLGRVSSATSHTPVTAIPYLKRGNKTVIFRPARTGLSLISLSFTYEDHDSVLATLRRVSRLKDVKITDLSLDTDTLTWSRSTRRDSVSWDQGWVAGSISGLALDRLAIPGVPYFIVTDSAGRQLWRGSSHTGLHSFLISALAK